MDKNTEWLLFERRLIDTNTPWRRLHPIMGSPHPSCRSLTLQQERVLKPWSFAEGIFYTAAEENSVPAWLQRSGLGVVGLAV